MWGVHGAGDKMSRASIQEDLVRRARARQLHEHTRRTATRRNLDDGRDTGRGLSIIGGVVVQHHSQCAFGGVPTN